MKRFLLIILSVIMVLSLVACGENKSNTPENQEIAVLSGKAEGNNGEVTVEVQMDGDVIKSISVTEHEETPGISDPAINDLPELIVQEQNLGVDVISGCTNSSKAVIEATKSALLAGGFDTNNYIKEVVKSEKGEVQTKEADVVIVGGGGSGLAAAASAAENGASVIVVEKMANIGGNTAAADGLYNAVDPKRQSAMGIEDSIEQFYEDTYNGGDKEAKPELVKILTENAMNALEWLESMGMKLDDKIYVGTGALWPRGHYGEDHTGNDYIKVLKNACQEGNVEIFTNTKGTELIQDETGRVVGVKAEGTENDFIFSAKNGVILTTGGFGYNVEMRQKYNTRWPDLGEHIKCSNVKSATGDGINMAEAVNANLVGMEHIQFYPMGDVNTGDLGYTLPGGTDSRIAINKEGLRFMAEDGRRDEQTEAIFAQTDGVCYVVVDADTIDTPEKIENVQKYVESGEVITGATVEEFAKNLGIDPSVIKETFDKYNSAVDEQNDTEFGRVLLKEKLDNGPFYAGLRAPTIHHTMGGIEINGNTEVLDINGNVIPGLYAAGENCGGVHGSNRLGGNALAETMVFGRLAGKNSALAK